MKPNHPLAALLLHTVLALAAAPALAHGDEDHSQDNSAPAQAAPAKPAAQDSSAREASSRLADGSLFVPKAVQHQLGIRTQLAQPGELSATLELNGRIVSGNAAVIVASEFPHTAFAREWRRLTGAADGAPARGEGVRPTGSDLEDSPP